MVHAPGKKLEFFSLPVEIPTVLTLLVNGVPGRGPRAGLAHALAPFSAKLLTTPVYLIVVGVKPFLTHHS